MRNTISAKECYCIRETIHKITGKRGYVLYDGDNMILTAEKMNYIKMKKNLKYNECFAVCEVFELVNGEKFAYCYNEETEKSYIVKL